MFPLGELVTRCDKVFKATLLFGRLKGGIFTGNVHMINSYQENPFQTIYL